MEGVFLEDLPPYNVKTCTVEPNDAAFFDTEGTGDDWISFLLNESPHEDTLGAPAEEAKEGWKGLSNETPNALREFSQWNVSPSVPFGGMAAPQGLATGEGIGLDSRLPPVSRDDVPVEPFFGGPTGMENADDFPKELVSGSVSASGSPSSSTSTQSPNQGAISNFFETSVSALEGAQRTAHLKPEPMKESDSHLGDVSQTCSMAGANFYHYPVSKRSSQTTSGNPNSNGSDSNSAPLGTNSSHAQTYSPESANSTGASEGFASFVQPTVLTSRFEKPGRRTETNHSEKCHTNGTDSDGSDGGKGGSEEQKREARLLRNRQSAQLSRQRKKFYMDELESQLKTMAATVAELNTTIAHLTNENVNLRRQLAAYQQPGSSGNLQISNLPPSMPIPNSYPPLGFMPGMPMGAAMASYPPVPIPRLKSSLALTSAKPGKRAKSSFKSGTESTSKPQKKMKKSATAATMAALAMCMCTFFFFPLNSGDVTALGHSKSKWLVPDALHREVRAGGRVLMSFEENGEMEAVNESISENVNFTTPKQWSFAKFLFSDKERKEQKLVNESRSKYPDKIYLTESNDSDSSNVPASLIMTRGDRLIQVDGNLIIQAVKAGDKAAMVHESQNLNHDVADDEKSNDPGTKLNGEHGLPEGGKMIQLPSSEKQTLKNLFMLAMKSEKFVSPFLKALPSGHQSNGHESASTDFIFDGTGHIFSSGLCTEVFQFESTVSKVYKENLPPDSSTHHSITKLQAHESNHTKVKVVRNGRDPFAIPIPPKKNGTSSHPVSQQSTQPDGSHISDDKGNNVSPSSPSSSSSMVVSLLASPRNVDAEKSRNGESEFSRIFVVVLVNGVKYVTYACMLPIFA